MLRPRTGSDFPRTQTPLTYESFQPETSGEAEVTGDLRWCRSFRCECLDINEDIGRPPTRDGHSLTVNLNDGRESPSDYSL